MQYPQPPEVTYDVGTRDININFDPDFEFTPKAALRIEKRILETFPRGTLLDSRTKCHIFDLAYSLQIAAVRKGEMTPKDPLGIKAAQLNQIDDHLMSQPEESEPTPSVEEIRMAIDDTINRLWAEGVCSNFASGIGTGLWAGYGIIEGLKRARAMTGEEWVSTAHPDSWKRFATQVEGTNMWIEKKEK